jgi:hypothetical protein
MISVPSDTMTIMLANGQVALIDEADWERTLSTEFVDGYVWTGRPCDVTWRGHCRRHATYVVSTLHHCGHDRELRINRAILGARTGQIVDHENCDGLDNTRRNLRLTDCAGNARNRRPLCGRQYKGVRFHKDTGKYEAYIRCNRKKTHLGLFAIEEEGARAYDTAALALFGEFARLNFPAIEVTQ